MRIFSGIQPTGEKHLGNYAAASASTPQTQEQGEAFFCIVDLHSISVEYDPAGAARAHARRRRDAVRDRPRSRALDDLRAEPRARAHAEANWLLSSVTSFGELRRMTQFKEKSDVPGVRLGRALHLSRAAGRRHPALPDRHRPGRGRPAPAHRAHARRRRALQLPLRRDLHAPARRLSRGRARKIMDLQEPDKKMSTTGGNRAGHGATSSTRPDEIRRKFKIAVTDSGREVVHAEDKAGISNLIEIMSVATGESIAESRAATTAQGYGTFKADVAEAVVALVEPIQRALPRAARRRERAPSAARARRREGAPRRRVRRSRRCTSGWASSTTAARGRLRAAAPRPRFAVSSRHSPGASPSRSSPAYRTRCRCRTGWPTASHMRLTWCLRPSCSVSSRRLSRVPRADDPSTRRAPSARRRARSRHGAWRDRPATATLRRRPRRPSGRRSADARAGARGRRRS